MPSITNKAGYRKIVAMCELAKQHGHSYVWVDTCCIDKTSNAELTEAINSMFGWYKISQECYAYLSDLESDLYATDSSSGSISDRFAPTTDQFSEAFRKCRWLTRG